MRGAPSANVHRRLFLHGVQDAGVMNEDEEEVEEDDQRMGDGNEEEAVHFGLVAMGPSLEGGGEGEEEEVEEEGDLAILDVEQQRRDSDEAARAATFQALGEAQRSQARVGGGGGGGGDDGGALVLVLSQASMDVYHARSSEAH
eukprot:482799-Pelagomonas_calceolata.AAC.1